MVGIKISTRRLAISGMLGGITILLGLTPLGLIPVGVIKVTTMHIPVLIGTLLEGPLVGTAVGALFALFSLIKMMAGEMTPVQAHLLFHPVVIFLPRLLISPIAYAAYIGIKKLLSHIKLANMLQNTLAWAIAAIVGTLANTAGVLSLAYIINGENAALNLDMALGDVKALVLGIAATNGVPECVAAVIIVVAVMGAMTRIRGARTAK